MAKEIKKAAEELAPEVSPAKAAFLALIETYKKQNPAKAEAKKDEFAKKLATL